MKQGTARERIGSDEVLYLALLAVLVTVLGYRFGLGNQVEALPIVMRLLDPSYLTNDFYVESASQFGPRFYYAQFVAALARVAPLPVVFILLVALVNFGLAAISHLAARHVLRADELGGLVAATLVVGVPSFSLGMVADVRFIAFQPGSLSIPFALAAFWAGLAGRPVRAAALAAVASVPHPLYGAETGAVALATAFVANAFNPDGQITRSGALRSLGSTVAGAAVLGGSMFVVWGLPMIAADREQIPSAELISILAVFRAPHHYLPSVFPPSHYASFVAFAIAAGLAFTSWVRTAGRGRLGFAFLAAPVCVGLALVAGYVFVELWPSRWFVTAQTFRLLYLLKWQGLLLFGWLIAGWIRDADSGRRVLGWLMLVGSSGGAHAPVALVCVVAGRVADRLRRALPAVPEILVPAGAALATIGLLFLFGSLDDSVRLALAGLVAALLLRVPSPVLRRALPVLLVLLVTGVLVAGRAGSLGSAQALAPVLTLDEIDGDDVDVARWARRNVAANAVFVAPASHGAFRVHAQRALVVDWKALPFEELAMREWRDRIRFCYGAVVATGFAGQEEMDANYRHVTDERLGAIRDRYGATHAVLYRETPTELAVRYANATYQVVEL